MSCQDLFWHLSNTVFWYFCIIIFVYYRNIELQLSNLDFKFLQRFRRIFPKQDVYNFLGASRIKNFNIWCPFFRNFNEIFGTENSGSTIFFLEYPIVLWRQNNYNVFQKSKYHKFWIRKYLAFFYLGFFRVVYRNLGSLNIFKIFNNPVTPGQLQRTVKLEMSQIELTKYSQRFLRDY